jgi:gluconolactonase
MGPAKSHLDLDGVIVIVKVLTSFLLVVALDIGVVTGRSQNQSAVVRLDPTLDEIVSANAKVEKIADGLAIGTGPVWVHNGSGGYLLFSDLIANVIDKWTPDGNVSIFLKPSGFTGTDASDVGGEANNGLTKGPTIGSNGLTMDRQGRIVFCAHGDRDVVRLEKNGKRTILADRYEGKRLNSPNDLVYKSDGSLYFTDPTGGLRLRDKDPKKELAFDGVFLLRHGKLQLLSTNDITDPNGLAFSPDEKHLYLNDTRKKIIMRFDVQPDDTIVNGQLFIDMSGDKAVGVPDGMKVDKNGNVYCTGPGGLWIMSPDGKHLGTVLTPRLTEQTFGDADGKTLYMTGITELFRIRVKVEGIRP